MNNMNKLLIEIAKKYDLRDLEITVRENSPIQKGSISIVGDVPKTGLMFHREFLSISDDWKTNHLKPISAGEPMVNNLLIEVAKKYNLEGFNIITGENGAVVKGRALAKDMVVFFEQGFYTINNFQSRISLDKEFFVGVGQKNYLPLLEKEEEEEKNNFSGMFNTKPKWIKENENITVPEIDRNMIESPSHYKIRLKDGREVEVVEIIEAVLTEEEFKGFIKGNAIKYILRAGKKGKEYQDLMKAREVLGWLKEDL